MRNAALLKIFKNLFLILLILFGIWFVESAMFSAKKMNSKYQAGFDEYHKQAEKNR